jgi:transcriptional regulator with XRE-family HTH domain
MSLTELGRRLGVSHTTVHRWERGDGFTVSRLSSCCDVLGITERTFFSDLPVSKSA